MKSLQLYVVVAILVGALLISFQIYQKNSVAVCTEKSSEVVKSREGISISNAKALYDLFYKACMGRRGFER